LSFFMLRSPLRAKTGLGAHAPDLCRRALRSWEAGRMMFTMSRAFVKDSDQDTDPLPERAISEHPNLVTARGLALIEARVRELEAERSAARAATDTATLARVNRDLRYFQSRRESARLVTPAANSQQVRFGVRARLRLGSGDERAFQLVGEDEADPKAGLISYVSPLAKSLMGKEVGERLAFGDQTAEIIALES
jgi:transcription elongation GreA/GreB family factor